MNVKPVFNFIVRRIVQNKKKMERALSPKYNLPSSSSGLSSSEITTPKARKTRSYKLDGLFSYFASNNKPVEDNNCITTNLLFD